MTNMHDMHMDRLQIFSRIHSCASRGHLRSSYGVKKGHLGSKFGNTAKCTWYAYHSIGNFLLNPMVGISRSSEVILRGQKRSFGVKNLKYGQIHKICISFDGHFFLDSMVCISRSFEVILGVKKSHLEVKNLEKGQIHIIFIWFDSKFYSDSNGVNIMVIQGHQKDQQRSFWGQKRSFWSQKSQSGPYIQDMHIER